MKKPRTQKQIAASRRNGYRMGKATKTQKQCEASRKTGRIYWRIAQKVGADLPRTKKQKKQFYELSQRPRTKAQWQAIYENLQKAGVSANDIVKHHNDLSHGKLRPDDITFMTHSEHCRLHSNLRNFLYANYKDLLIS